MVELESINFIYVQHEMHAMGDEEKKETDAIDIQTKTKKYTMSHQLRSGTSINMTISTHFWCSAVQHYMGVLPETPPNGDGYTNAHSFMTTIIKKKRLFYIFLWML